eukprot:GHRR01027434.1.p1 GENE.GHRR01027434.1~~GHRR01027434.1.p1  ORF type:complete len:180 (+),score=36.35 GHRR01027434.1:612-1151(+)
MLPGTSLNADIPVVDTPCSSMHNISSSTRQRLPCYHWLQVWGPGHIHFQEAFHTCCICLLLLVALPVVFVPQTVQLSSHPAWVSFLHHTAFLLLDCDNFCVCCLLLLLQFDSLQTCSGPEAELRRPPCNTLLDVFMNIRDDEMEHVKTMHACQDTKKIAQDLIQRRKQLAAEGLSITQK